MRIGAIIQARSNSSRFPNKVLLALHYQGENTGLDHVLARAEQVKLTECVILATTDDPLDDAIAERPGRQPNWCYRTHPDNALPLVAIFSSSRKNKNLTLSSAENETP